MLSQFLLSSLILSAQAADRPIRHALIIGISDYSRTGLDSDRRQTWPNLSGEKDASMLGSTLRECKAFSKVEIKVLAGYVTKKQVIDAFNSWIVKPGGRKAARGDVLYVHFSGHGCRFPDPRYLSGQGVVRSGLVLSDSFKYDANKMITNVEFANLIAPLSKDAGIFFTIDSCYSATATFVAERDSSCAAEALQL